VVHLQLRPLRPSGGDVGDPSFPWLLRRFVALSLRSRLALPKVPSGAPPGPDTIFDVFVPGVVGAPGPSGVVPGAVPGVSAAVPVAQVAGS
jgi:hypothetical protein